MTDIKAQVDAYYTWCKTRHKHVFLRTFIHTLYDIIPGRPITWADLQTIGYTSYDIRGPRSIILAIRNEQLDSQSFNLSTMNPSDDRFDVFIEHEPDHTPVIRPRGRFGKLNFKDVKL